MDHIRKEWQYRNPVSYQEHRRSIQLRLADIIENAIETGLDLTDKRVEESLQTTLATASVAYLVSIDGLEDHQLQDTSSSGSPVLDSHLEKELKILPDDEKELIRLFYVEGFKQFEIAKKLNISNSSVSRLHNKILEKLRKKLEGVIEG